MTRHFATYGAGNIDKFINDMQKYSIGMDEWLHRMGSVHETKENYPPYNLLKETEIRFRLEVALAGFKEKDISVYTENNKLFVEGKKGETTEGDYVHRGLAKRDFTRVWTIADDVAIDDVTYEDGILTVILERVIPDHQKKKIYM